MQRHGRRCRPTSIHADSAQDAERYQTVFAKHPGAVATHNAPHFDDALFAQSQGRRGPHAFVTLHVGAGTFQPVKTEILAEHQMHSEWYDVPGSHAEGHCRMQCPGGRVVAVGTTTVRTWRAGRTAAWPADDTRIFITPGFQFQQVDLLVTNHLPKSSLMMLVSPAFAGHAPIMALYRHAIAQRYRFSVTACHAVGAPPS